MGVLSPGADAVVEGTASQTKACPPPGPTIGRQILYKPGVGDVLAHSLVLDAPVHLDTLVWADAVDEDHFVRVVWPRRELDGALTSSGDMIR
jgi:hypothetical protein